MAKNIAQGIGDISSFYCKSMGKLFKVEYIALTDKEANNYCRKHKNSAVIASNDRIILIAEKYSATIPSHLIPE